jgi:hypothetical protein
MGLVLDILGYGVIALVVGGILYAFVKLLATGLNALTKHDD